MAFKMKGSAFKSGGVQGTSGHASALKQKQEQDSALQCRMHNKASQFTMKSPLEQSCPPGTIPVDEEGNPIQMKTSAFKQYTDEELEREKKNIADGMVYSDDVVVQNDDGTTTTSKTGTKEGTKSAGVRSGDPVRSKLMSDAISRGDKTFEYNGKTYTTERGSSTPGGTDEMSYTTKPEIQPLSLDLITPKLDHGGDMKPVKSTVSQKKLKKIIKKRERKAEKERKAKRIIPKVGRALGKIDLNPFDRDGWASGKNRRKAGRKIKKVGKKIGKALNPKNLLPKKFVGCDAFN